VTATVMVGFVYGQSTYTPQFGHSLEHVLARDFATNRRIVGRLSRETSGVHVPDGRCKIVADFLNHPAKPEWLWMVDSDATFADDVLEQLIAAAHPTDRPIVGALAFGVKPYMVQGTSRHKPSTILKNRPTRKPHRGVVAVAGAAVRPHHRVRRHAERRERWPCVERICPGRVGRNARHRHPAMEPVNELIIDPHRARPATQHTTRPRERHRLLERLRRSVTFDSQHNVRLDPVNGVQVRTGLEERPVLFPRLPAFVVRIEHPLHAEPVLSESSVQNARWALPSANTRECDM
jgi:hypothetical protein